MGVSSWQYHHPQPASPVYKRVMCGDGNSPSGCRDLLWFQCVSGHLLALPTSPACYLPWELIILFSTPRLGESGGDIAASGVLRCHDSPLCNSGRVDVDEPYITMHLCDENRNISTLLADMRNTPYTKNNPFRQPLEKVATTAHIWGV